MADVLASPALACAALAVDLLNRLAPCRGVKVMTGLAYGPGPRHRLDVYAPANNGTLAPVVTYPFVAARLAARGIMTLVPHYRLHPEARFPAFMKNTAEAVGWARTGVARLRAAGAAVETRLYRGLGHRVLIGGFAAPLASLLPVRRVTLRFIGRHGAAA